MRKTIAMMVLAAAAAMRRHRARRDAMMMRHLSDAQLKDIGLTPSDIWRVHGGDLRRGAHAYESLS
ncbi:DUF1127 domain-containing protein [Mesorhizobium sp. M9A.F.Ca.ET.002.03.1.2]|uniref:DUF1127 domain-containing protein n=1 Tax=Mesorhizobium sp. M9A.F.Ca.ET.002.03.1.2 TaxID=2493668 RepID=UPI000F74D07B|nr:DUF1127 domain-containing protein [Mesorhizobium sp. M9A.F.Ca.ET.002.03.1.2]AZO01173.1 DUF1127 domain-containing protein [Mesorhizobium sp. M9A.F.Ca.ET.002.03.1.2]